MPPRLMQAMFAMSVIGLSWLAMMAVHEIGHVLHALVSGGSVVRVILHPLAISRTDVAPNPHPQFVAWGGACWGTLIPLGLWLLVRWLAPKYAFLAAFFAGFCLIANGLYLAADSFTGVGDGGDLLSHGAAAWQLLLFGVPATIAGFWLWHGLGPRLGLGLPVGDLTWRLAIIATVAFVAVVAAESRLSSS